MQKIKRVLRYRWQAGIVNALERSGRVDRYAFEDVFSAVMFYRKRGNLNQGSPASPALTLPRVLPIRLIPRSTRPRARTIDA